MLFHVSLGAHHPRRVATVLAELCGGVAAPFPPVGADSWIALTGDDRGTAFELYPLGTVLREGEGGAVGGIGDRSEFTATHAAIGTQLGIDEVLAIAAREGWPAAYHNRGGLFGVVELWIEGRQMIELLTPEMQHEYRASMTIENWRRVLASNPPAAAA